MTLLLVACALAVEVADVHGDVVIDGALDEPAWQHAAPIRDLLRYQPVAGGPPAGTTEVRFLQDRTTLYIGIRVRDAAQPIRGRLSQREAINADDQIGVYLDPFGDAQAGYIFYLNALGVQQDIQFTAGEWNVEWNTVLRSRGRITDDRHGYDLELAIPFRSLKYPSDRGVQTWGLILTRKSPGEGAKYAWPPLVRGHPRLFAQAGRLEGVRPPRRGSGVELVPGLAARVEGTRPSPEAPLSWTDLDPWHEAIRPSVDLRAGVTPNLALVATANPDFSQVESDVAPVVLNARFAFRFLERRPFFTEGAGFFDDPQGTLYSRSIQEPLYGLKLAGREGRWSIGLLHAVDRNPAPSVHERGTPGFEDMSGRWAVDTLVRLRHDLPGAGWIGMTLADKRLVTEGFEPVYGALPRWAGSDNLGVDTSISLPRRFTLALRHDQSLTASNEGQLGGAHTGMVVSRPSGAGLGAAVAVAFTSVDYRQEMGFRNQSGLMDASASMDWTVPGRGALSSWTPRVAVEVLEEVQGEHFRRAVISQNLLFGGVHSLTASGGVEHRRELGSQLPGWFAQLDYAGQAGAAVELQPGLLIGREMDFRDLTAALRLRAQLAGVVRAGPIRFDLLARYNRLDREEEAPDLPDRSDDVLVRGRLLAQLHRDWGVRVISAYNLVLEQRPTVESSVLLTWLPHPFTAAYLGYAELTDVGGPARAISRSVFAKVHVMVRPDLFVRRRDRTAPSASAQHDGSDPNLAMR